MMKVLRLRAPMAVSAPAWIAVCIVALASCGPTQKETEVARLAAKPFRLVLTRPGIICESPEKVRLVIKAWASDDGKGGVDQRAVLALIREHSCGWVDAGRVMFLSNTPDKQIMSVRPEGETFEAFAPAGSLS